MSNSPITKLATEVDTWIERHGVRYFDPLTNMAMLTEEVGEMVSRAKRRATVPRTSARSWLTCFSSCSAWPTRPIPICRERGSAA